MNFDISSYMENRKRLVDEKLKDYFTDPPENNTRLWESIRYGLLAGGKRLRPILCMAACEAVCDEYEKALPVACAIEMIHTYSLVHDDLPSMDDDELRRGKPTNHTIFGEAMAILTGDALLTESFRVIVSEGPSAGLTSDQIVKVIDRISSAAGAGGMVLGQAMDLELEGREKVDVKTLKNMHSLKTGALIRASVLSGGIIGSADDKQLVKLGEYAKSIGLAYQIIDDVLDIEGGKSLGKQKGSDSKKLKSTYTSVLGINKSRDLAYKLTTDAVKNLDSFRGNTETLKELAYYLGKREF